MNARDILHRHYALSTRIMLAQREIEDLRLKATAIGSFDYAKDRVKASGNLSARYEKLVEQLVDRENALADQMEQWLEESKQVEMIIDSVENVNQHQVLFLWYILHLDYKTIAREMNYTEANIYALKRKGLAAIDKVYNKL